MRKEIVSFFKEKTKRRRFILMAVFVIAFIVLNGFFIYFKKIDGYYFSIVKKIIPYPAFIIGKEYITVGDFDDEVDLNKKLYELSYKISFDNSDEGRKNLQNLKEKTKDGMVETIIMQNVLSAAKESVTKKDIKDEYDRAVRNIGSDKEIADILKYSANISEKDVLDKIQYDLLVNKIKDDILYSLKLKVIAIKTLDVNSAQDWDVAKLKAEKIIEESNNNPNYFNNYYALDNDNGDIIVQNFGREYYLADDLPENFRSTFFSLTSGQISAPLKTDLGYYILKNEGQKGSYKGTFSDFISDQKNKTKVISFLH